MKNMTMIIKRNTNILIKRRNINIIIINQMKAVHIIMNTIMTMSITVINTISMRKNIIITNMTTEVIMIIIITIILNKRMFKTISTSKQP